MDESIFGKLHGLSALWDQLAGHSIPLFLDAFLPEVTALHQFQIDFPDNPPILLIHNLRMKVMEQLRNKFPAEDHPPGCGHRAEFN